MSDINLIFSLHGKTAIITGAMGYLGKRMTSTLADLGCDLILTDLPNSRDNQFISHIKSKGVDCNFYPCDIEVEVQRIKLLEKIKRSHSSVDILINNAAFVGTSSLEGWSTNFDNQSTKTWRRAIEVNLTAPFEIIRFLNKAKILSSGSSVINIGSIYSFKAPDYNLYEGTDINNPAAYSASKGGLLQLTRWLSSTLAPDVRVNSISLGGIFRHQDQNFIDRYTKKTPLKRMATESDIDGLIIFLSTGMSSYVTGQNIKLDGGWSI